MVVTAPDKTVRLPCLQLSAAPALTETHSPACDLHSWLSFYPATQQASSLSGDTSQAPVPRPLPLDQVLPPLLMPSSVAEPVAHGTEISRLWACHLPPEAFSSSRPNSQIRMLSWSHLERTSNRWACRIQHQITGLPD